MVAGTIAGATGIRIFVEGFPEFLRVMTGANSLVDLFGKKAKDVSGPTGLFSKALDFLGDTFRRVFEIASGILVAGIFKRIAEGIMSMAAAAIDAAAEFQVLGIRLEGLIARELARGEIIEKVTRENIGLTDQEKLRVFELERSHASLTKEISEQADKYAELVKEKGEDAEQTIRARVRLNQLKQDIMGVSGALSQLDGTRTVLEQITVGGMEFTEALRRAVPEARDLMKWLAMIGIPSPFTVKEIANVFTLAKSYGFVTSQAKRVTVAVQEFASGMGLGNVEMKRVIENLGQMVQQGKITGFEMRDLARGAFVPVNEVLRMAAIRLGMVGDVTNVTNKEVNDFAKSKGLDAVQAFTEAFIELVARDFPGAAERMGSTFVGLKSKIADFTEFILGFTLLGPVFDTLTERANTFFDVFVGDPTVIAFFENMGQLLNDFVGTILEDFPAAETIVDKFGDALNRIFLFFSFLSRGDITNALRAIQIPDEVIQFLRDVKKGFVAGGITGGLQALGVPENIINGLKILQGVFIWLIDNVPRIIEDISAWITGTFIPALKGIADWIKRNQTIIIGLFAVFALGVVGLALIGAAIGLLIDLFGFLLVAVVGLVAGWIIAFNIARNAVGEWVKETAEGLREWVIKTSDMFTAWVDKVEETFETWKNNLKEKIKLALLVAKAVVKVGLVAILALIKLKIADWKQAGKDLIQGFVDGIVSAWDSAKLILQGLFTALIALAEIIFGVDSPSKVYAKIGEDIMAGLALGISKGGMMAAAAMRGTLGEFQGGLSVPMRGTTNNSNITNFNISMANNISSHQRGAVVANDLLAAVQVLKAI